MSELIYTKPNALKLSKHPSFNERWMQERIIEDPTILGLGEIDLLVSEKRQPRAGRLDLLFHDEQLNRRYEVELMLGKTDPSHIIRCIEYWDIERRRYPAYDHVAVLVAEDITSRFLNVMSLFAGNIPLIAIQMVALEVGDQIALHFVTVLDQTSLRTDDTYEAGGGTDRGTTATTTDRPFWDSQSSPEIMQVADQVKTEVNRLTDEQYELRYRKKIVDVLNSDGSRPPVWMHPRKTLLRIGGYVSDPEEWVKRLDDLGFTASLKRGNNAVVFSISPEQFGRQNLLVNEFLKDSLGLNESDD